MKYAYDDLISAGHAYYRVDRTGVAWLGTNTRNHPMLAFKSALAQVVAKCDYCGVYGALGRCESCGAPNKPQ